MRRPVPENMLACVGRPNRPLRMQVVGLRVVDRFNRCVSRHRLIAAERLRDAVFLGECRGLIGVTAGDGAHIHFGRTVDRCDEKASDVGRAGDADTKRFKRSVAHVRAQA